MLFGAVAIALSAGAAVLLVAVLDVWLHARYAPWLGYNVWGYRGPVAPKKRPGEYRVVMLGGSVAYGYAVAPSETIEAFLERDLRRLTRSNRFTVINLAYNNEGTYSFTYTLQDYAYLGYDLAVLYEGYNDLTDDPQNTSVFRHQSPVFTLTGYLPIFPLVFREKAAALMHGGDVGALYGEEGKRVFHPSWTARTEARVLQTAAGIESVVEKKLAPVSVRSSASNARVADASCEHTPRYCQSIAAAVDLARTKGAQVLVATQPYVLGSRRTDHIRQQQDVEAMLARTYARDANVSYVNLGRVLDLSDERLSGDAMHPTGEGDARTAAALARPVLQMASIR